MSEKKTPNPPVAPQHKPEPPQPASHNYGEKALTEVVTFFTPPPAPPAPPKPEK